jgi:SNF2 family DNA or RNA helicase
MIVGKKPADSDIELIFKDIYVNYRVADKDLQKAWESHSEGNKITEHIMSAKSSSALMKVKFTAEYADNLMKSGSGPLVIYSDHVLPVEELELNLGKKYSIGSISGKTSMVKRNDIVTSFEEGNLDIIVATIGALNTGITLVKSNNMIINDCNWNGQNMEQVYHRIFRIGQTRDCVIHNILGSVVDKNILRNIKKNNKVINAIMGDMK